MTAATWVADVQTNLMAVAAALHHEVALMSAQGSGVIVDNASNLGLVGVGDGGGTAD